MNPPSDWDNITMKIAWLLPRRLAYWCAVRVGAHATQGQWSDQEVPALLFADVLKRWEIEHAAGAERPDH